MDLGPVPDDPDLLLVPAVAVVGVVVVAPEVQVVEEHSLDALVVEPALAGRADDLEILLVQHLVALEVDQPVAGAALLREVGLVGVLGPARVSLEIPDRVEGHDLVGADRSDAFGRVVVGVGVAQGDHELVHQRERRADRLDDRVMELGPVAQEGEAAQSHRGRGTMEDRGPRCRRRRVSSGILGPRPARARIGRTPR